MNSIFVKIDGKAFKKAGESIAGSSTKAQVANMTTPLEAEVQMEAKAQVATEEEEDDDDEDEDELASEFIDSDDGWPRARVEYLRRLRASRMTLSCMISSHLHGPAVAVFVQAR